MLRERAMYVVFEFSFSTSQTQHLFSFPLTSKMLTQQALKTALIKNKKVNTCVDPAPKQPEQGLMASTFTCLIPIVNRILFWEPFDLHLSRAIWEQDGGIHNL